MRALVTLALALACGASLAHKDRPSGRGWERIEADEPAPHFDLVNQDARRVTLKDLRGRPAVLTFLYTTCTDVCPVLLHVLAGAEQRLGAQERDAVRFVGITVDPKRDTPQRLKAYMGERGLDPARWQLLTGSLKQATDAANAYGVVVRPAPRGDFVHNSIFVVIDARGRERAEFHGMATPPEAIAAELRKLVGERRR
jgi:protein SCO1/2